MFEILDFGFSALFSNLSLGFGAYVYSVKI